MAKKLNVRFSASGYGTKHYVFNTHEELMQDVEGTACEIEGTIQDYGNEIAVVDRGGDEAARWEIL